MHEKVRKIQTHKNILYGFVVLLIIVQISSFVIMNGNLEKIKSQMSEQNKAINASLISYVDKGLDGERVATQQGFMDVAQRLNKQEESFSKEITVLKSGQGDFSSVVNDVVKSVVSVGTDKSAGSGFFVSSDGFVVTNEHVISGAQRVQVLTSDQEVLNAVIVGTDKVRDIALLKVSGSFTPISFADSDELQVGRKVIAIGNPYGLSFTVTEGIISALKREGPNGNAEYLQTDVSLNPGNSGGPLIEGTGKLVGVNNFKIGEADNIGFALESNSAKKVVNTLANSTIIP